MTSESRALPAPRLGTLDRLLAVRIGVNREIALYAVVFAIAFALRFWDLGARALHHDESIHAQWSWRLLQGDYTHDPVFHGPLYYHVQGLVFFLFGSSDYTSRLSAAIFGMALVALPLLLRRRLGAVGTFAAVALIALSPTLVYYSRFFREDIYMAALVMLMVAAMWRYFTSGLDRWLIIFAVAFAASMATKEATYLVVAVFLVFLDLQLSVDLARATLADRGEEDDTRQRVRLALLYAPWAWGAAALWPFIGRIREARAWGQLPRSGDVLVVLGTLTVPLLSAVAAEPLEKTGLVEAGRLVCRANMPASDRMAIGGLFAVTVSGAAFVGLQWRARAWAIAAGLSAALYLTLFTSFWTNLNGLCSGPWGGIDYWLSQHGEVRGDQPWFYYFLLMPAYEFLPLAICVVGAWWSLVRGNAFSRFLWMWMVGVWVTLSWAGEKMPWLNVHLALPACLLAAWTINRAWRSWENRPDLGRIRLPLLSAAIVAMGALLLIAFLPGGPLFLAFRAVLAVAAIAMTWFAAQPFGRKAAATFGLAALIGALSFFSIRTMIMVVYERGDVPKDMLIYTQSSPEIPRIASQIDALAAATGEGFNMPIAVDSTDSFAWPWAWYLRDYRRVSYADFRNGPPAGDFRVLLVNQSNAARTNDALAQATGEVYGAPQKYPHRWWFDETYKYAMDLGYGSCTAQGGNCGPFRFETWKHIFTETFTGSWVSTWLHYIRDHDPGRPSGSVDAVAYFPANFDTETRKLTLAAVEPPKPVTDEEGRPVFGGLGRLPGQFFSPADMEQDAQGNLYVIDSATKRLQKFDSAGNFIASVDIRINPEDPNEQSQPWGLGIATDGTVFVADTFGWRIRAFTPELQPTGLTFGMPPTGNATGTPGPMELFGPRDVAFDRDGNLWVTDGGHDRIVVYTPEGEFVRAIGGPGQGEGQFDEPIGIAAGGDGMMFVADMFNSRVQILDAEGTYRGGFHVSGWGGQEVNDKPYLQPLRNGNIALGLPGQNEVRIYDRQGNVQATVTGGQEPLSRPYGIVETLDGKLWVVEGGSGRVRQFPLP